MVKKKKEQSQGRDLGNKIHKGGDGIGTARVELPIMGMSCAACAKTIERVLNTKLAGVMQATVNFAAELAVIEYKPTITSLEEMIAAIEKAGYKALPPAQPAAEEETLDAEQAARRADIAKQTRTFIIGLIFTIPLFF